MKNKIAILFTNDAHCSFERSDDCYGYASVAGAAELFRGRYGIENVCLVDAGDSLGGGVYGLLSKGELPLDILNACGYDMYALGNADFTLGVERLCHLNSNAKFLFLCCNFLNSSNDFLFEPYVIKHLGDISVAFVGAATPYTLNAMNPGLFSSDNAECWHFCQDTSGEMLYNAVQHAVDVARGEGAQFVVLLSHLGQKGQVNRWRSDVVVHHTHGIDAVIDGHSHERYSQSVLNKDGLEVPVVQAGTSLSDVGCILIDKDTLQTEVRFLEQDEIREDKEVAHLVQNKVALLKSHLQKRVGKTSFDLYSKETGNRKWAVRSSETNLGDLVADAFGYVMDADIALAPSWIIRDNIYAGEISLEDIYMVLPLGQKVARGMLTGRQIADALEYGFRALPYSSGSFLQVAGLSCTVDCSVPTPVLTDESDSFLTVDGCRRVQDICIAGIPLAEDKQYSVAAPSALLKYGSSGFSMMCSSSADEQEVGDVEAVGALLETFKDRTLPDVYRGSCGMGRIKII